MPLSAMWPAIAILVLILAVILIAIAVCWLCDRIRFGPEKPWSQEEHDRRLLNPDFAAVEMHFGCNIPQSIRELYSDEDLILKKDFVIKLSNAGACAEEFYIAYFVPAAEQSESYWQPEDRRFIIANSGCGDPYYVELSLVQSDPLPVYVFYHDGGDTLKVANSLQEFAALCKRGRPAA